MKHFFLILFLSFFISNNNLAEENKNYRTAQLDKLFNALSLNNDINKGDKLEKEIWAIWNKHPSNKNLTEKLEFGTKLMYQGRYDYSLQVFTNIINSDPNWSEAWNKRATLLFFMKEYQKSLHDIDKVLNLESRHFGALTGRAQIYIEQEFYDKALQDLKKAKKIHPVIRGKKIIEELEKIIFGKSI